MEAEILKNLVSSCHILTGRLIGPSECTTPRLLLGQVLRLGFLGLLLIFQWTHCKYVDDLSIGQDLYFCSGA